jgi:hypothetical protein
MIQEDMHPKLRTDMKFNQTITPQQFYYLVENYLSINDKEEISSETDFDLVDRKVDARSKTTPLATQAKSYHPKHTQAPMLSTSIHHRNEAQYLNPTRSSYNRNKSIPRNSLVHTDYEHQFTAQYPYSASKKSRSSMNSSTNKSYLTTRRHMNNYSLNAVSDNEDDNYYPSSESKHSKSDIRNDDYYYPSRHNGDPLQQRGDYVFRDIWGRSNAVSKRYNRLFETSCEGHSESDNNMRKTSANKGNEINESKHLNSHRLMYY